MNAFLSRYYARPQQSDLQRARAKEAAADLMAWLWIGFIAALVIGSALLNSGAL